jgi:iron complex outermembrane receptor protein
MYEFRGYDAAGASIYADAAGADASLGLAARKLVESKDYQNEFRFFY